MPVTITITGETAAKASVELFDLAGALRASAAENSPSAEAEPPKVKPATRKRSRETVEPEPAPTVALEERAEPKAEPAQEEFTEDDARKALMDLLAQPDGKDLARATFARFNASRLSEIKPEDRKAFIAAIANLRGVA